MNLTTTLGGEGNEKKKEEEKEKIGWAKKTGDCKATYPKPLFYPILSKSPPKEEVVKAFRTQPGLVYFS